MNTKAPIDSISTRLLRCYENPKSISQYFKRRLDIFSSRYKGYVHNGTLRLYWYNVCSNLGDEISPLIVQKLSGMKVCHAGHLEKNKVLAAGSIIGCARKGDVVWGAGAIEPNIQFSERDFEVAAVRGPKTRHILLSQGLGCPEIYGDPGMLISDVYLRPDSCQRAYRLGIVPHYVDKELFRDWNDPSVLILDIQSGREKFFSDLWQCQRVVSSSLHGIIFAESYGIPAHWMVLSDGVYGGDFKFHDYYLGTDRDPPQPLGIDDIKVEKDWVLPHFDKQAFLHAFPFSLIYPEDLNVTKFPCI